MIKNYTLQKRLCKLAKLARTSLQTPKIIGNSRFTALVYSMLFFFILGKVQSQTTEINPAGDGGFETGATLAANNWSATTGTATQNQWTCSTGATAGFSGTNAAYITNNTAGTPPPHTYTLTTAYVSHLYRDVTVPASETIITLTFNWIGVGEGTTLDRLRVWLVPTSFTPVYGTQITASGTAPTGNIAAGLANYNAQATWATANITIPTSYAGTTFRVVFEWRNDGSVGTQPPGGLDNISLTSIAPAACIAPSKPTTFALGTVTSTTIPASFTGTANGYLIIQSNSATPPTQPVDGTTYAAANISSLGSGLTLVQNSAAASFSATGLNPGTLYYYYIFAYNNTACSGGPTYNTLGPLSGSATTTAGLANDNCGGAIALTVNPTLTCSTTTSGTTVTATQSQAACAGTADDDAWYTFVATATSHIVTVTPGTLSDAVLQIFSGTCGGTFTSLACVDNTVGAATETTTLTGLSIGTTYYVRVYSYASASNQGTFTMCVTTQPACTAPTQAATFVLGATTTTTIAATFSGSANGYLVIRSLTNVAPAPPVNGTTYSAANIATLGAGYTFIQSGTATSIADSGLSPSATYYYFIYAYSNTACTGGPAYNTVAPLTGTGTTVATPANDNCPGAIALTVNPTLTCTTTTAGTSVNATQSQSGCLGTADDDVWYRFVATTTSHIVTVTPNTLSDAVLQVLSGTCGGTLTSIACVDSTVGSNPETTTLTGLTAGTTYYVRVYSYSSSANQGTFSLCVTTQPPCSAPSVATAFVLGTPTSSTLPASFSGTANGYLIVSSLTNTPPATPINGTIYTAANISNLGAAFTFVQNSTTTTFTASALAGNTKYYYFIFPYNTTACSGGPIYNTTPLSGNGTTCSAVPNTVSNSGNTTSGFTINWTAPTGGTAAPVTYTLQVTTDAGYTANVAGSPVTVAAPITAQSFSGLTANTTYYYRILASNGCNSAYVTGSTFTGYCSSTSTSSTYYISNFSTTGGTANITNNASGYSATGYGNFTGQVVSQINYGSVSFSAAMYNGTYTYGFNIWVDWNDDMDFNDAGELVYASGTYVSSATGSITVPATASVGNHRMRIRANYFSTNPDTCGSISSGETEDYTFTVLPPLPCSANPTSIAVTVTSQTTATVNWTAPASPPANGYQYYVSLSNATPSATDIPTGSVGAGVTTISLTGLLSGSSYSIWVRSNCGGALGQGVWVGPVSFHQPNCNVGNGTGTTNLPCPAVVSGGLGLSGADPAPINSCIASACVDLEATYVPLSQTTAYTVSSIPYTPPYQFGCLQNPVSINVDDIWSQPINLPFNFCFYGNNYNQCLIGSNGVITFDQTNNTAGGYSTWSFANNIPNATLFKNTIFGVYHDIDPSVGGEVGWELITLNTGCRALVASWSNIPMFSSTCNAQLYTGMMVLYENTNVIDVYIQEKNVCGTWNSGNAIVGIQNIDGTQAVAAPNRNGLDTDWAITNEAWRFTPSGPSIASIRWHEGAGTSGPVIATTSNITVCPVATTIYTAEVSYALCDGSKVKETDQTTVTVTGNKVWNGSVDTDWNKANNWTPVGIPNNADCVVIPVTANNPIVSGTGYNGLAGTLSVLNGAILTVNPLNSITVTNWVNVQASGTFQIENDASLVQVNDVSNTGNIKYKRDVSIRKLDYVYWSSPVANYNVSNISAPIVSGPIYQWNTTVANPNGGQGNWESATGATMLTAKGYIVRGSSSFSLSALTTLNASFTGVPNNGPYSIPIYRGSDQNTAYHAGLNGTEINNFSDNFNLLGNPYPSAIRGSQFLFDNNTKIEGNIKLWTHGALPAVITSPFYESFVYNYNLNDYLTYNFTGTSCCPAASAELYVGAGQGFFVQMKDGPTGSDVVNFTNSLRSASYDNSIFYRTTDHHTSSNLVDLERHRIWLDLIDFNNQSDRTLIGYVEGATMDADSFFDAGTLITDAMTIYSLIGTNKYTIQGRAIPFSKYDTVPIGVKIPAAGLYKIGINAVDGLFENPSQGIYLEDTQLGIIHDLRQEPYSFEAVIGSIENRFVLRYVDEALHTETFTNSTDIQVVSNEKATVYATGKKLKEITVYDLLGRTLAKYTNIKKATFEMATLKKMNASLLLRITLEDGTVVTKKMIY